MTGNQFLLQQFSSCYLCAVLDQDFKVHILADIMALVGNMGFKGYTIYMVVHHLNVCPNQFVSTQAKGHIILVLQRHIHNFFYCLEIYFLHGVAFHLTSLSLTTTIMLFFLEDGIFKILSFGMGIRTQGLKLV